MNQTWATSKGLWTSLIDTRFQSNSLGNMPRNELFHTLRSNKHEFATGYSFCGDPLPILATWAYLPNTPISKLLALAVWLFPSHHLHILLTKGTRTCDTSTVQIIWLTTEIWPFCAFLDEPWTDSKRTLVGACPSWLSPWVSSKRIYQLPICENQFGQSCLRAQSMTVIVFLISPSNFSEVAQHSVHHNLPVWRWQRHG